MSAMREDWTILRTLFPQDWDELGRASGAVTRLRGFDSMDDLLRTLLMHVGCGWSLRETAARAKLAGIADVSDVTLLNRLRQSTEWLRLLCQQLWTEAGVALELALEQMPVRVLDATVVKEPGKTGSQWRIHYSMRLPSLTCDYFDLTPAEGEATGESTQVKAPKVLECYRLRWQIELIFKRLKSIVQLGHVPKQDDDSSRAWLYGKLFLALLSEKLIRTADSISPWGYQLPAPNSDPESLA